MATLRRLEDDETLLVQSGKPVGVFRTHADAPRVLIANAMLVPEWGDWEDFREFEAMGLTMYGQMTAGSWIYIGTQGILQGTYETFGACAAALRRQPGRTAGVSAGLGGMGGAQPLAATMNGGVVLFVEVDRERIERRLRRATSIAWRDSLDEALGWARGGPRAPRAAVDRAARQRGGGAARAGAARRALDVVTDQTSAHDLLNGYVPAGLSRRRGGGAARRATPKAYLQRACESMAVHVRAMLELQRGGRDPVRLRQQLPARGGERRGGRLRLSRLRARVHPPAVLRRAGAVPLGGALRRPGGHLRDRPRAARGVPGQRAPGALDDSWRASA